MINIIIAMQSAMPKPKISPNRWPSVTAPYHDAHAERCNETGGKCYQGFSDTKPQPAENSCNERCYCEEHGDIGD
jgi:hypothetical protein